MADAYNTLYQPSENLMRIFLDELRAARKKRAEAEAANDLADFGIANLNVQRLDDVIGRLNTALIDGRRILDDSYRYTQSQSPA